MEEEIEVLVAGPEHEKYVDTILDTIAEAAKVRGTGIAKRTHEYLAKKMMEAKAVIALTKDGRFAGFSYIETWENQQYVTTSGLIVHGKVARVVAMLTFCIVQVANTASVQRCFTIQQSICQQRSPTMYWREYAKLILLVNSEGSIRSIK